MKGGPRLSDLGDGTSLPRGATEDDRSLIEELEALGRTKDLRRVTSCGRIIIESGVAVLCGLGRRGCYRCAGEEARKRGRTIAVQRRKLSHPLAVQVGVWSIGKTDLHDTMGLLNHAFQLLRRRKVGKAWTGGVGGLHVAWERGRWYVHVHLYVEGARAADLATYKAAWSELTADRGTFTLRRRDGDQPLGDPGRAVEVEEYIGGADDLCPRPGELPLDALGVLFEATRCKQFLISWGITERGKHMANLSPEEWVARRCAGRKLFRNRRGAWRREFRVDLPVLWGPYSPFDMVREALRGVRQGVDSKSRNWAAECLCTNFFSRWLAPIPSWRCPTDLIVGLARHLHVHLEVLPGRERLGVPPTATRRARRRPRPRGSRTLILRLDPLEEDEQLGGRWPPSQFDYVTSMISVTMDECQIREPGRAFELMALCYLAEAYDDARDSERLQTLWIAPSVDTSLTPRRALEDLRQRLLVSMSRVFGVRVRAADAATKRTIAINPE